jgi:hypothetical protein
MTEENRCTADNQYRNSKSPHVINMGTKIMTEKIYFLMKSSKDSLFKKLVATDKNRTAGTTKSAKEKISCTGSFSIKC